MRLIARKTFVAGVAMFGLAPSLARAEDEPRAFRCKARLDRNRDKKTIRQVEVVVPDGKTASALDGSWAYDRMPRTPRGLYVTFTAKRGAKIHLSGEAEYGSAENEQAGGTRYTVTDAKLPFEEDLPPNTPIAYPWTIAGEDYTLVVSVQPVDPKEK